jgi:hypothetical protein
VRKMGSGEDGKWEAGKLGRTEGVRMRRWEGEGPKQKKLKAERKKNHRPDEISAKEISPRINRLRPREINTTEISPQYDSSYLRGRQGRRLTGQVGQAEIAEAAEKRFKNKLIQFFDYTRLDIFKPEDSITFMIFLESLGIGFTRKRD